jgi:hypothetical protein
MRHSLIASLALLMVIFAGVASAAPSASMQGKIALWCSAAYVLAAQTGPAKSDPAKQSEIMAQSGALSRLARTTLSKDGFSDEQIKAMIDETSTEVVDQFSSKQPPAHSKAQCERVLALAN